MSDAARYCFKEILWIALAGCVFSASAVQTAASTPSAFKRPSQQQPPTAAASSLTAEEIGHRVLKLIDTIHTVEDISPAHIEKMVGVKVEFNAKDPNDYGFGARLTSEWSYDFGSLTDASGGKPTRLELSFDNQTHDNTDIAPICGLDMDGYMKTLKQAGFKASPYYGEHGRHLGWNLSRDAVSVTLHGQGENDSKVAHDCVSMLELEVTGA
jgi:hypothetical protein